jgi:hypothetical protein
MIHYLSFTIIIFQLAIVTVWVHWIPSVDKPTGSATAPKTHMDDDATNVSQDIGTFPTAR